MSHIKLVDDDNDLRKALTQTLELAGFSVQSFADAEILLQQLQPDYNGIIVSDLRMPGLDGLSLLEKVTQIDKDIPVVLITGHGDVSVAVKAIQKGAYDFIEKPFRKETIIDVLNRAGEKRNLIMENRNLRSKLANQTDQVLIGESNVMMNLKKQIASLAQADVDVLINGETGTGKELVARELHRMSPRSDGPFVAVNCAAIADSLVESELFGHEAGSFTGALQKRIGKFEHANKGTIFLDEIESIPQSLAAKILRVLQERKLERVGSNKEIELDLRVLAATKLDLKTLSEQGKFRQDLYYRLNVIEVFIPALRERLEDIPLLFEYFSRQAADKYKCSAVVLNPRLTEQLLNRQWPGNVRELKNIAERYVLTNQFPRLEFNDQHNCEQELDATSSLQDQVRTYEKMLMVEALRQHNGDVKQASKVLKVPRKTFYDKMKKYSISRTDCN